MIIKSFTAESAAAALKRVRFQMGGEAVVLKTRQLADENGGLKFEVTALLDKPSVAQTSTILTPLKKANAAATRPRTVIAEPPASESRLAPDVIAEPERTEAQISIEEPATAEAAGLDETQRRLSEIEEKLNRLFAVETELKPVETSPEPAVEAVVNRPADRWTAQRAALRNADVPEDFIEELIAKAEAAGDADDQLTTTLTDEVTSMIATNIEFKPGDRLLFIGLPASGKTSVMAKLTARLLLTSKCKIKLMTLDNFKIGGLDEIHSYGELLGVDAGEWSSSMTAADEIVLIDSPGLPEQPEKRRGLRDKIAEIKPTYCFVMVDVMTRASDTIEFIESIKDFGPTHLIATMTDLTGRQGSIIAACRSANIKLAFRTDSPGGIGSLRIPAAAALTRMLLGETVEVAGE